MPVSPEPAAHQPITVGHHIDHPTMVVEALKRHNTKRTGRKRRRAVPADDNNLNDDVLDAYKVAASWIPRGHDLFANIGDALTLGVLDDIRRNEEHENLNVRLDLGTEDASDIRNLRIYRQLITIIPSLNRLLTAEQFMCDSQALNMLSVMFDKQSSTARCDDTRKIRNAGIMYITAEATIDAILPPIDISPASSKAGRGFNHPLTARLLCPHRHIEEYDNDPELFRARIQAGSVHVTADALPTFLYDFGHRYEQENILDGLFQSQIMARIYRLIFTGPGSALTPGKKSGGPRPLAHTHNLRRATSRTIAYVAVQVRFMLSNTEKWDTKDGSFDAIKFYDNVVRLFETDPGPDSQWTAETLAWYNQHVFGLDQNKEALFTNGVPEPSDFAMISAQHRMRIQLAQGGQSLAAPDSPQD